MQNNQAIPFNKENFRQILSMKFAWVIVVSIPGALIADFFNIPLAWFLGPMIITSVVTLAGIKTQMPKLILSSTLIILGLYIGNYIDKKIYGSIMGNIFNFIKSIYYLFLSILTVFVFIVQSFPF